MRYSVHVQQDWVYEVDADTPEDAAQIVIDGDGPRGECTGYNVGTVTTPNDEWRDVDLRAPLVCRGGCGTPLPPSGSDECITCLIARLDARSSASPTRKVTP